LEVADAQLAEQRSRHRDGKPMRHRATKLDDHQVREKLLLWGGER
jgi:hypothetical protein